jgi:branched-chain amino acid transport system ATP-binding protein
MTNERPILRLERVTKRFGGMTAIDDLSFDVRRGSRTALIGPNGAGKTTVFNIVTGAVAIDAGSVYVDGGDITRVANVAAEPTGIRDAIRAMKDFPALEGPISFGANGDALKPVYVIELNYGKWNLIETYAPNS